MSCCDAPGRNDAAVAGATCSNTAFNEPHRDVTLIPALYRQQHQWLEPESERIRQLCPRPVSKMRQMRDGVKIRRARVGRPLWWLVSGLLVVGLAIASVVIVARVFDRDPCDSAIPFATELGLRLSADEHVVSCQWHSSFPDSSGTIMVRTASLATRKALLERSGVSEELDRSRVSINNGPFREEVRRPNLERSRQVFLASAPGGDQLAISYDEGVESGLLLTVSAVQV